MAMTLKCFCSFILLVSLNVGAELVRSRRYNIRKDLTEHCRNGVALSVFLGTHVTEASSQVLQFGQAVIPYSCYIAARTEAGNNIILVMQDMQDEQLQRACKDDAKQIIVYEIHDTFGGYWGELPDFVINPKPLLSNVYTLETMPTSTVTEPDYEESSESVETTTETETTTNAPVKEEDDTISIEIPIVNISGRFLDPLKSFKEIFGMKTTHKPEATRFLQYQTSIYPIVQFSEEAGPQSLYAIEYNFNPFDQSFNRLTSTISSRPKNFWNLYKKTTRFKFSKYTHQDDNSFSTSTITAEKFAPLILDFQTSTKSNTSTILDTKIRYSKTTSDVEVSTPTKFTDAIKTTTQVNQNSIPASAVTITRLKTTQETHFNYNSSTEETVDKSSTLMRNVEINEKSRSDVLSDLEDNVWPQNNVSRRMGNDIVSDTKNLISEVNPNTVDSTTPLMVIDVPDFKLNISQSNTSATPSVTLVDRETWENLVLAAPKMASVLNKSYINENETLLDLDPSLEGVTLLDKAKRDKRYLQGISVRNMMPRPVTSEPYDISKTEGFNYLEIDVEEFGKNVERINEEAQSRVALRYPHKFLGKELFNLCDHKDLQTRHIFMFNSSRIWIRLSNFSLESISIVLTEARRVLDTDSFCDEDYLECQLSGSRVCIDALNACDGVPNCGAYDIYDEDRLRCGHTPGMQQSVCVAAFAFLVLAHTMIYIIMYWLKRCVPKVSTAFFIYSEGAENMLNLQSVMRSPYFEDTSISDTSITDQNFEEILPTLQNKKVSVYQILRDSFKQLWSGRFLKGADQNKKEDDKRFDRSALFSQEFFKTAKYFEDTSAQTTINMNTFIENKIDGDEADELKILKFCRDAKCICSSNGNELQIEGEPRLSTDSQKSKDMSKRSSLAKPKLKLNIERLDKDKPFGLPRTQDTIKKQATNPSLDSTESKDSILITTTADIHRQSDKKLRFDEIAITIKNSEEEGTQRFGTEKLDLNLDTIEVEREPGTSKQPKLFWLGKKKKKPTGPPLSPWPRPRANK